MKFYIAAPFFNKRQVEIVEEVKEMLTDRGFEYFSPKDDCLFENGKGMDSGAVFKTNCDEIIACDAIVVVTDGKDVGTMFEAGFANGIGKENIIYVWVDFAKGGNFNLMLAHSAKVTCMGLDELDLTLVRFKVDGEIKFSEYVGDLE